MESAIADTLRRRSIVLVGMMGAGKSSVGRRLAARLGIAFVDADTEIESAAGMTISEIFEKHGEAYFRAGEARVIARLLDNGPQVLATGGGAIMNPNTRDLIRDKGISVWLKADANVLLKRTKRRTDRPLAEKIKELLPLREPVYAQSDIVVQSSGLALYFDGAQRQYGFTLVLRHSREHLAGDRRNYGYDHDGQNNARRQHADSVDRAGEQPRPSQRFGQEWLDVVTQQRCQNKDGPQAVNHAGNSRQQLDQERDDGP